MKIDQSNISGSQQTRTQGPSGTQATPDSGSSQRSRYTSEPSLDRVEVSDLAQKVSDILQVESTQRADQVNQLKAVYQAGSYRPDIQGTSRAIVHEALAAKQACG